MSVFVAVAMSVMACKEDKPAPQTSTSATAETAVSSVAAAPSAPPASHGHRSCPSRVHGATSTASDVDGGLLIAVTATDDATIEEIHARAGTLEAAANEGRRGRFCPEMHEDASRKVTTTKNGAEITLVPTNPADLTRVRSEVRERLARGEKRPD